MLFTAIRAQMTAPHRHRRASISGATWFHPEKYGRIIVIKIYVESFPGGWSCQFDIVGWEKY
jgi:hypothetical protein